MSGLSGAVGDRRSRRTSTASAARTSPNGARDSEIGGELCRAFRLARMGRTSSGWLPSPFSSTSDGDSEQRVGVGPNRCGPGGRINVPAGSAPRSTAHRTRRRQSRIALDMCDGATTEEPSAAGRGGMCRCRRGRSRRRSKGPCIAARPPPARRPQHTALPGLRGANGLRITGLEASVKGTVYLLSRVATTRLDGSEVLDMAAPTPRERIEVEAAEPALGPEPAISSSLLVGEKRRRAECGDREKVRPSRIWPRA